MKILKIVLIISVIVFFVSWYEKDRLPGKSDIIADLYTHPVQDRIEMDAFEIKTEDQVYIIEPLYTYELFGLVVSQHDCGAWFDMYHHDSWQDFINVKDLCVIWGQNIETQVYKDMTFKNQSFTCNYSWPNAQVLGRFCKTCLSNNHLLTQNQAIKARLMDTGVGDQIYLKGYLAKYRNNTMLHGRGTSTTRTDTGNGACETIYIKDYQVLKPATPVWRVLFKLSRYLGLCSVFLMLVLFIASIYSDR